MREHRIVDISPAEVLAIVQRSEWVAQLQQRGLQALGKDVAARVVAHDRRIELVAMQPDRDGRLTQNLYVSVEVRQYERGSRVEFTGSPPVVATGVFLLVFALILGPVWTSAPAIAASIWGVAVVGGGVIAWMSRHKVHALNMVFMQVLLEAITAGPRAGGAASSA